jgi:lipopolysaccharide assembly outer membrane protein LptD (OstA)
MTDKNGIRELHGRAQIETVTFVLRADEASYNPQTRQIEAHGDVHITLK